jgi:predicted transcriptional regulator
MPIRLPHRARRDDVEVRVLDEADVIAEDVDRSALRARLARCYLLTTMTATSIKLPKDLKKRIAAAAKAAGQSPHAFMVTAIERQTSFAEARLAFVEHAREGRDSMERTGMGYEATEVHAYLERRARGKRSSRPKPKPWRD